MTTAIVVLVERYAPVRRGLGDVHVPARASGASIVLVHGGAFVIGSRRAPPMRYLAQTLTAHGITVFAIDYRLLFRGGRFDDAVADVVAAVAYWRSRARDLGLHGPLSLVGLSAGGTLALRAAEATSVDRVASCFGLYDLSHVRSLATLYPRLLFATADRTRWQLAGHPRSPTLLLHGDADRLVPVEQAVRLAAERSARALPTRLVIYPDAPHGFFRSPSPIALRAARELVTHVA